MHLVAEQGTTSVFGDRTFPVKAFFDPDPTLGNKPSQGVVVETESGYIVFTNEVWRMKYYV